jgi:uncharacterized membrane protein YphA (DoxX/SURF4 family)
MNTLLLMLLSCIPRAARAHEVYVLDPDTVQSAMAAHSPNPFTAYYGNEHLFYFWGFVCFVIFSTVIAASWFRFFEKRLDPFLYLLKKFALPVARIAVGICFVTFAITGNLYGSELFVAPVFGGFSDALRICIGVLGVGAILGLYTRVVGFGMLGIFVLSFFGYGTYILTYTDYLGAALLIMILGGGIFSLDSALYSRRPQILYTLTRHLQPYAFAILRVCFGWGVLYAAVYAKFIHSQLALEVVTQYNLTRFFPFDPLFVVLGALIVECIAGLMILFGVAVRWTLLFLAFWLTLSLLYFRELIWPHTILFGLAIALFLHGYDHYSLEGFIMKNKKREPVF